MRINYTFALASAVIFYYIAYSSQSEENPYKKRYPGSASSGKRHAPDMTPVEDPSFYARSKSPRGRPPSNKILGYSIRQLGYIRLIPRTNQSLAFEFRNYIFPAGLPINWRADGKHQSPVPATEHIVLSTSDGDIFAILSQSGSLYGIYWRKKDYPRVKMNMISGAYHILTPDEMRDCPVGIMKPIFPHNFNKAFSNSDSLEFKWNCGGERTSSSHLTPEQHSSKRNSTTEEFLDRAESESPPGRAPTDEVFGHSIEQLGYLRLIPCTNQNQRFEFRRYVFPADEAIRLRIENIKHTFGATREYIVLSTSNGDVFAILDHNGILRGIYSAGKIHTRKRINMVTGVVENMTSNEKKDCPVGKHHPVFPNRFMKAYSDCDSLQFKCDPPAERRLAASSFSSSSSSSPSPARHHSPNQTDLQELLLDAGSSSPPGKPPSHEVFGYSLAELGYVRLIPQNNPNQQFEFRRYIFSSAKGIRLMSDSGKFMPVPTREHIVLSTFNGDVFAILEYTGILRGTYQANRAINLSHSRIRINMITGKVSYMTEFEMMECPVGRNNPINPRLFNEVFSNQDTLQYLYH